MNLEDIEPLCKDLASLLNRYSRENESNTPDFILADYLIGCLISFEQSVNAREKWYGRQTAPDGGSGPVPVDPGVTTNVIPTSIPTPKSASSAWLYAICDVYQDENQFWYGPHPDLEEMKKVEGHGSMSFIVELPNELPELRMSIPHKIYQWSEEELDWKPIIWMAGTGESDE
jgi:hypothetical protein